MTKPIIIDDSKKYRFENRINRLKLKRRYYALIKKYINNPRIVSRSKKNKNTKIEFLTQDLEKIQHEPIIIDDQEMQLDENYNVASPLNNEDSDMTDFRIDNEISIDNEITIDDVVLDDNQSQTFNQPEYGSCCFCGEGCNPSSQACGRCVRNGHNY
ncbi:putative ORFan [Tupanvirus deep ocean]|uniref:ORFan n=2 Tax=Tupanvirus TaxID=2094720 RepID=A0AC62A7V1_9VIRU|nr:putative ORFan [Tupanvirus deep ocean]QKU33797.1 putative ORFan [Tupanvirus deep ocean]